MKTAMNNLEELIEWFRQQEDFDEEGYSDSVRRYNEAKGDEDIG